MSLKAEIAPQLPFLRRYARALTGSQTLGDKAVREMLEALAGPQKSLSQTLTHAKQYSACFTCGMAVKAIVARPPAA